MWRACLTLSLTTFLCGCVAQINEKVATSWLEHDLICGIDESVTDEQQSLVPEGWLTKPYSPSYWQEYWNHRVYYLGNATFERERSKGYVGLSGRSMILYALKQRREVGLADLVAEERNKEYLATLYEELNDNNQSSCKILGHRSPQCRFTPAQHPGAPYFQRPCGGSP